MIFSSYDFLLLFLPVAAIGYIVLESQIQRNLHVLVVGIGLTSLHSALAQYIYRDEVLSNRLSDEKKQLADIASDLGIPFLDYTGIRTFGCSPQQMWDLIHLMPECADLLVRSVTASVYWGVK